MRRFLQINTTLNKGSHGRIAEQLGIKIIHNGWESYYAYGRDACQSISRSIKIGCNLSIKWHVLMTRILDDHGLWSKIATKRFIHQIDTLKPDLIHLHNIHGYYLNYPLLFEYLSSTDIPVVWTFHDCWPMTGHCSNPDNEGCGKFQKECHDCPLKSRDYPQSYLWDNSRRNYYLKKKFFTSVPNLHIVTVSNWLKSVVKQSFLKELPTSVICNGIDTELFKPTKSAIREKLGIQEKFVILGVSNIWWPIKGFNDFIQLSKRLDNRYQIIMIGVGKGEEKKLPQNIIGIPRTECQTELAEYYSMADVVMSLSYQETFGMTIVEGMSCGTPAIVYDRTATPELVTPETGMVAHAGDLNSVIDCINLIKANGKSYYSQACRQRAVTKFDKDVCFEEYMNLYKMLIYNELTGG